MFGRHHSTHHHPHDPADAVEWAAMLLGFAFVITVVVALAFQIGTP